MIATAPVTIHVPGRGTYRFAAGEAVPEPIAAHASAPASEHLAAPAEAASAEEAPAEAPAEQAEAPPKRSRARKRASSEPND